MLKVIKFTKLFFTLLIAHVAAAPAQAERIRCSFKKECGYTWRCTRVDYNLSFVEHEEGGRYGLVDLDTASIEGQTEFAFREGDEGTLLGVDKNTDREPIRYYLLSFGKNEASMSIQAVDSDNSVGWVLTYHGTCLIE